MSITNIEAFYLGTMADLDPDEGNWTPENAANLAGTIFGSTSDPLYSRIETLSLDDSDNDGEILENDNGQSAESLIYNGASATLDTMFEYNVTITYNDGTTAQTGMLLLQDTSGRVFLAPYVSGSAENNVLDDRGITSIRLDSYNYGDYRSVYTTLEPNAFVVCFLAGSMIATPEGERAVEALQPGDEVLTLDRGACPILWRHESRVRARGRRAPVRIGAGALGPGIPRRDVLVSPQHRVLLRSPVAERMFGSADVLVPAVRLCGLPGIAREEGLMVARYHHFLLDGHQIVFASGLPAESFYPGPVAMRALGPDERAALAALLPGLAGGRLPALARPVANPGRTARFLERFDARAGRIGRARGDGDSRSHRGALIGA